MLIRTSSGNTSVGHLSHAPSAFSAIHRPDVTFSCGGLMFPVHSVLLAVSSRFWADFFGFVQGKMPEAISLDAVKCEALSAVTMSLYLDFVYSGALPTFDAPSDALELLRLGAFFSNAALTAQLAQHLSSQLGSLPEEAVLEVRPCVLEVFRAAVDLKQRRLVTECLVLLLPQFGRCTGDATVAAVVDYMDATLSKAVLTQLAMQGTAAIAACAAGGLRRTGSTDSAGSDGSVTVSPRYGDAPSPSGPPFSGGGAAGGGCGGAPAGLTVGAALMERELEELKRRFVGVLAAKGWGQ